MGEKDGDCVNKTAYEAGGATSNIFGLLGLLFIGLKLGNVIDWSWWWVTAPFWGPVVLVIPFIFFCLGMAFIARK